MKPFGFTIGANHGKKPPANQETRQQRRHANLPARFAFRRQRKQRSNTKRGRSHTKQKTPHLFFRPTPCGSHQVVNQVGKLMQIGKFSELMQWQQSHMTMCTKSRTGQGSIHNPLSCHRARPHTNTKQPNKKQKQKHKQNKHNPNKKTKNTTNPWGLPPTR